MTNIGCTQCLDSLKDRLTAEDLLLLTILKDLGATAPQLAKIKEEVVGKDTRLTIGKATFAISRMEVVGAISRVTSGHGKPMYLSSFGNTVIEAFS